MTEVDRVAPKKQERRSIRAVMESMPAGPYSATRYETQDEIVVSLWADGRTWDFHIPKGFAVPVEEHTCARTRGLMVGTMTAGQDCGHSRRFHTPSCECGCPAFVEPPDWQKGWPIPNSGHPNYGRAFDEPPALCPTCGHGRRALEQGTPLPHCNDSFHGESP